MKDVRLGVLGAGVMGTGIAVVAIGHGIPVVLVDVSEDKLADARHRVDLQLRHARLMGTVPAKGPVADLTTTMELAAVADATAVIEAIIEDAEIKAKVLGEASRLVRTGTPLVSNTSGIPIGELGRFTGRPHELVGIHFMNPAYLITMVEVIRGALTSDETMTAVTDLLTRMGRRGIVVQDAPGFVTSRLLHPMINEAARIVEAGVTTVDSVDDLMRGCLGHPTGPLRTADLIGLDNLVDALRMLWERTGNASFQPCELLLEKVSAGHLGRKSGKGFYDYKKVLS
ncbi:3-hydroxyacyl-CoA dehydrogenase family protein [Streptosporangium sp. NBC_01755]|uniref:3-hydroxyacyl-CoA dehydrogenase family protein n=1 Tax=unclassified Streptosporangium TaxID=2632669 RepID=UPI002DDB82F8|nr:MULTISPECIES: 3-hydroxyacyl-CoA dehydrogenase family protein [unclassified Streptosporangium]WSA29373.1 3-hydroxyacyl-CoA dehydrogenase family protein [Streptosporangium sp. NBC_01810]WSC99183.1 3-hydroxyacyl-CoA dehydrogenase family protein [Streptosporangium sp. NBC_01755]